MDTTHHCTRHCALCEDFGAHHCNERGADGPSVGQQLQRDGIRSIEVMDVDAVKGEGNGIPEERCTSRRDTPAPLGPRVAVHVVIYYCGAPAGCYRAIESLPIRAD